MSRWTVFVVTYAAYATYYLGRKGLSVAKATMGDAESLSPNALATLDTTFLAAYAAGQFLSAAIGDRVGARALVAVGMLVSAAATAAFGLSSSMVGFVGAMLVNGVAQATGWPGTTKAMADATTRSERGRVMGVWTTCYQVGGIAATALAAWAMSRWGWRAAFVVPAVGVAAVGLLVWVTLRDGAPAGAKPEPTPPSDRAARGATIAAYGASYFFVKIIRYSLLLWLPWLLKTRLGFSATLAATLSVGLEIGGVVGAIALGAASDRLHRARVLLAAGALIGLAVTLLLWSLAGSLGPAATFTFIALTGALLFGPDTLISGAASQDLGGTSGAARATGLVNGVGSVGAVVQGYFLVWATDEFGVSGLLRVLVAAAVLAALALAPVARPKAA